MATSKGRREKAYAAVDLLVATFPAAFTRFDRKPLKLGIDHDLIERGIALACVRAGVATYCRSNSYLAALQTGAPRLDLDGNPAGVVTADDASFAAGKLAEAAERAARAKINRDNTTKAQAAAAAKKAAAAQAEGQARQPKPAGPGKGQTQRPPAGATVVKQPPLVVRRLSRGRSLSGARR